MSHRTRVLALAVAYVGLLVASTIVLPWFHVGMGGLGSLDIGLRSATVCSSGQCVDFVLPSRGLSLYVLSSRVAFWGSMAYSLVVLYQIYWRVSQDYASPGLTRKAVPAGIALLVVGLAAGYLFAPELGGANVALGEANYSIEVSRSMAPLLYVLAHIAGIMAMMSASKETVAEAPLATPGPYGRTPIAEPVVQKEPTPVPASKSDPQTQHPLRGKLNYVVAMGEVTRAGVDAHREDGSSQLVLWRDVVGFVVRRTPDDLDGVAFADIVSAAGATLRIVPWSRLTGDATGQGDERLRALATIAQTNREGLAIDGATKKFLGGEPAAQLRDAALLATHDERLA
ncbi:MAG TPA: hypothetical protein VGM90_39505 [Kofleriaceae bacterium]